MAEKQDQAIRTGCFVLLLLVSPIFALLIASLIQGILATVFFPDKTTPSQPIVTRPM